MTIRAWAVVFDDLMNPLTPWTTDSVQGPDARYPLFQARKTAEAWLERHLWNGRIVRCEIRLEAK